MCPRMVNFGLVAVLTIFVFSCNVFAQSTIDRTPLIEAYNKSVVECISELSLTEPIGSGNRTAWLEYFKTAEEKNSGNTGIDVEEIKRRMTELGVDETMLSAYEKCMKDTIYRKKFESIETCVEPNMNAHCTAYMYKTMYCPAKYQLKYPPGRSKARSECLEEKQLKVPVKTVTKSIEQYVKEVTEFTKAQREMCVNRCVHKKTEWYDSDNKAVKMDELKKLIKDSIDLPEAGIDFDTCLSEKNYEKKLIDNSVCKESNEVEYCVSVVHKKYISLCTVAEGRAVYGNVKK